MASVSLGVDAVLPGTEGLYVVYWKRPTCVSSRPSLVVGGEGAYIDGADRSHKYYGSLLNEFFAARRF